MLSVGENLCIPFPKIWYSSENLYKMNKMKPEDPSPKVGDILRLR